MTVLAHLLLTWKMKEVDLTAPKDWETSRFKSKLEGQNRHAIILGKNLYFFVLKSLEINRGKNPVCFYRIPSSLKSSVIILLSKNW